MKKIFLFLFIVAGIAFSATAQESKTMYIMKGGNVDFQMVVSDIDSIIFYNPVGATPEGKGFSDFKAGEFKTFVELGYPGEVGNFTLDPKEYGDLWVFNAYCGDNIVLLSRLYLAADKDSPYAIKVVDKTTLEDAGSLNLGSIDIADIKMVTSDYKGRCVAAVVKDDKTEFFYWKSTSDVPVSVGTIGVNMATMHAADNAHANFQVAGDITGNAWITALAPLNAAGNHYRVKVTDGKLASTHSIISTGYSSADCTWFQMISPLDASDEPNYVIGDSEGTANDANSIHCYVNNFSGSTLHIMPGYWQGNNPAGTLQEWWVGTGYVPTRSGNRSPVVSALPINGKSYVVVTTGTSWWHAATVLNADLSLVKGEDGNLLSDDLNIAFGTNRNWCYGTMADWYYDEAKKEAYLSIWFGRFGLRTYKMTCDE